LSNPSRRRVGIFFQGKWQRSAKYEQDFYNEVVKFVRGESHNIEPGTIGMMRAEIAKQLITGRPELLDEDMRTDLIEIVEATYDYQDTKPSLNS